jgi:meso-butanediol dehydrogenase / (S,S)-butanediol dehydrogenase / diacetyl reductase
LATSDRVAVVTGSSKGLGAAISERLAREGFKAWVTYHRDRAGAEQVAAAIERDGGLSRVAALDVRDEASVRDLFSLIGAEDGRLDVLVCNAVQEIAKSIEEATLDEWHTVVLTKLDQCFLCTKYALPLLRRAEGSQVIYMTSQDGVIPDPAYIGYCTGTAGIIAFVKAMAKYLPQYGVRANAISPGAVKTPLWDALGGDDPEMWTGFAKRNPMGRVATVDDVAAACALLVSDDAGFVNGNFIYVDGGARWVSGE